VRYRLRSVKREYDARTGRPLDGEREAVETLTDTELDTELLIAAVATGRLRLDRFATLRHELLRRRFRTRFQTTVAS
jgi:hypothetical protein